MSIDAIIFDFDGLILDTETPEVDVWNTIYAEYGLEYSQDGWSQIVGGWGASDFEPAADLQRLSGRPLDVEGIRQRHRAESNALILREPVRDGVREVLAAAKRLELRLAVASSSERTWVVPHLTRLGLIDNFEKVICRDDVGPGRTKPHPDVFLKALAELKVKPEEALVFEDSPNGVKAARAAGMIVVAIPNPLTALLPMDGAHLVLKSLAELPLEVILKRVGARSQDSRGGRMADAQPAT